jgi:hypothetical protein
MNVECHGQMSLDVKELPKKKKGFIIHTDSIKKLLPSIPTIINKITSFHFPLHFYTETHTELVISRV